MLLFLRCSIPMHLHLGTLTMFLKRFLNISTIHVRNISHVQGQSPAPKVREYFYYIDHEGMLFLDDARMKNFTSCFKEKKFLEFFFNRLKVNDTDRYKEEFPFLSICGRERNYIRCDDLPIVFTHIFEDNNAEMISYAHVGDKLRIPWEPNRVCMFPDSGRVYHPAPDRYGSIGLIRSKLAIELSSYFTFDNGEDQPPTSLRWKNKEFELDQHWWRETYIGKRKAKVL
ncbi:UPF0598 protein CG30010 isoform X2 [Anopheles coustani]|uniref:UPF0598 protein CG30010 isoform X2 n=1 Tax=Anopheles coustani TaxID=139045 RepID=UPI002657DCF9|nr:UPF0598 protein CG30010 isoform X2 [Anopheles coustani]